MLNRKQLLLTLSLVWLVPGQTTADAPDSSLIPKGGKSAPGLHADLSQYASDFYTNADAADHAAATERNYALYSTVRAAEEEDSLQVAHQDNSLLRRLGRLRSLSLVTFMRTDKTRVFLGVTKEGHPGIYFATQPDHRLDDARHLELYRLPYVNYDDD